MVQMAAGLGAADRSVEVPSEEDFVTAERARTRQGVLFAAFLPDDLTEIDRLSPPSTSARGLRMLDQ